MCKAQGLARGLMHERLFSFMTQTSRSRLRKFMLWESPTRAISRVHTKVRTGLPAVSQTRRHHLSGNGTRRQVGPLTPKNNLDNCNFRSVTDFLSKHDWKHCFPRLSLYWSAPNIQACPLANVATNGTPWNENRNQSPGSLPEHSRFPI